MSYEICGKFSYENTMEHSALESQTTETTVFWAYNYPHVNIASLLIILMVCLRSSIQPNSDFTIYFLK